MSEAVLISRLVAIVERLNSQGDSWRYSLPDLARIAVRRWESFSRRNKKPERANLHDRVRDLANGLQAHFEPNVPRTHPSDWRALAGALADALTCGNS